MYRQTEKSLFKKKLKAFKLKTNDRGREFLDRLLESKEKWSLAYNEGSWRHNFQTSNMVEIFNGLLKGC